MSCMVLAGSNLTAQTDTVSYKNDTVTIYSARTRNYVSEDDDRGHIRHFSMGADLDTLQYIIASPFDNWYFELGGGVQTFIGNELESAARWNKVNYNVYMELGKWVIPDIAVSLNISHFDMSSQSLYMRNPYIDLNADKNKNGYYNTHAYAFSVGGQVILDWTNLCLGYERGQQRKFHVTTPVGLGWMFNFGEKLNQREDVDKPFNSELYATAALHFDYYATPHVIFTSNLRGTITRGSFDYSPYNNTVTNLDIMPAVTLGIRFNLFREFYLRDGEETVLQEVNHEFQAAHNQRITDRLQVRDLYDELDRLQAQGELDNARIAELEDMIDSLKNQPITIDNSGILSKLGAYANRNQKTSAVVYFQLDRYNLDYSSRKTLQHFAQRVKDLPDTNVYYIIGCADSATGYSEHNWSLSVHRCQSVYNQLTKVYQVPANQLKTFPLGGITEYDPEEMNRVCFVVLKSDEIVKLIEKWQSRNQQ